MGGNTKSEDTLIFAALTPKVVKLKTMYKILQDFADNKQAFDLSDRFNVILFQESGPVYLDDFSFSFDNILKLLKDYDSKLVRANVAGGIFVAATFIIDVYKKISDKAFRLIILTDKGSFKIPDHYLPVLLNLLDKVKDMPLYIDVLRIGIEDYEEDLKYKQLTEKCGGKVYFIKTPKVLAEVLGKLARKKTEGSGEAYFQKTSASPITLDNQQFFENLADKPKIFLTSETCAVCFKKDDKTVVQCPNCESIAHMSCWAHWAKTSNIGIPYVFRCHNCFNLLRLDKGFVEIVQTGKAPPMEIPEKKDLVAYLHELEAKNTPQAVHAEDPLVLVIEDEEEEEFGGGDEMDFSNLEPIPSLDPIPQPTPESRPQAVQPSIWSPPRPEMTSIPIPELEPIPHLEEIPQPEPEPVPRPTPQPQPRPQQKPQPQPTPVQPTALESRFRRRRSDEARIVICSNCSNIGTTKDKFCAKCGAPL